MPEPDKHGMTLGEVARRLILAFAGITAIGLIIGAIRGWFT